MGSPYGMTKLEQGAPVLILEVLRMPTFKMYFRVRYYTGEEYFVYADELSIVQLKPTGVTEYFFGGITKYATTATKLYSEPQKIAGKEVTNVQDGARVVIYKGTVITNNLWYYAKVGNKFGYIPSWEVGEKKVWSDITGNQTRYVVSKTKLYTSIQQIAYTAELEVGTEVTATKKATIDGNTWAYVKVGEKEGFVLANCLGTAKPEVGEPETPTPSQPTNTTPPATTEQKNDVVPTTNTEANYVTGSNVLDTKIDNGVIDNATSKIDANTVDKPEGKKDNKVQGNDVLKVIVILIIIGLVVVAIVRFEKVRKQK